MTRVVDAMHIADRLNNSNRNKESPQKNPSKSLLRHGKGFQHLTVQATITNICMLKLISWNQYPGCIHRSRVLSVQHHLKLD